jgi:hypothetical protein
MFWPRGPFNGLVAWYDARVPIFRSAPEMSSSQQALNVLAADAVLTDCRPD